MDYTLESRIYCFITYNLLILMLFLFLLLTNTDYFFIFFWLFPFIPHMEELIVIIEMISPL